MTDGNSKNIQWPPGLGPGARFEKDCSQLAGVVIVWATQVLLPALPPERYSEPRSLA